VTTRAVGFPRRARSTVPLVAAGSAVLTLALGLAIWKAVEDVSLFTALLAAGIAQGAIVALAALGFLLLFKATGTFNFAQGDLITLGAYWAIFFADEWRVPTLLSYLLAIAVLFAIGLAIERFAYAPLRGRSIHVVVIATLGAAFVIRALVGIVWGTEPKTLDSPAREGTVSLAGARIAHQSVLIVGVTLVVVAILLWAFHRTSFGRQVRALAADRETAKLQGIRVNGMSMLAFGLSAALAGVAGVLVGPVGLVDLELGFPIMLKGFAAAIIGGFGSLGGVIVGGVLLGVVEKVYGGYWLRDYASAFPFVFMLIMIAIRPQGLFSAGGARERL
jgi:branched-chain amino acid transport system permease protein